jgi:hypothetical protein
VRKLSKKATLRTFRAQQLVDQIEDQQSLHAVIGETLPRSVKAR